jgi:hypothetical protein
MYSTMSPFQALNFLVADLLAIRYKNNLTRYSSFTPNDKHLYTLLGNEKVF